VAPPDLEQLWASLEGTGRWHADEASARWVFPALAPAPPEPAGADQATDLIAVSEVRRQHRRLVGLDQLAQARMRRPFVAAAAGGAHEALAAGSDGAPRRGGGARRDLAMAVGSAVHRVLEAADLATAPAARADDLARWPDWCRPPRPTQRSRAPPRCCGGLPACRWPPARRRRAGRREVPVLLPPEVEGDGPVGYVAGVIDLLLREPATGEIVVVDYKTDEVEAGEELERRAAAYALQGRVYARAVRDALGLPSPPRVELWFLWPGLVKQVDS
jgi:ATP-dependent exoDNAse (exonuclease V) beta subunit